MVDWPVSVGRRAASPPDVPLRVANVSVVIVTRAPSPYLYDSLLS